MKIEGLQKLSESEIEEKSAKLLRLQREDYFDYVLPTELPKIVKLLTDKYKVIFDLNAVLGFSENGERILGATNLKKHIILVDQALQKDRHKFNFTLAHELGHLILHRNLTFLPNESFIQEPVNTIKEAYYENNEAQSEVELLEWQANIFAIALLMPGQIFQKKLKLVQKELSIRKPGRIRIDDQACNMSTYYTIISELSNFFGTSNLAVQDRLQKLNLIETSISGVQSISDILGNMNWTSKRENEYNPLK